MAVVVDQLPAGLQKLETRFRCSVLIGLSCKSQRYAWRRDARTSVTINSHFREEEGRDLLGKRTMDFKVSYLDAGLTNSYFSDSDTLTGSAMTPLPAMLPAQPAPQRVNRRYKTHLRDFLTTTSARKRTKFSAQSSVSPPRRLLPQSRPWIISRRIPAQQPRLRRRTAT